MPAFTPSIGRFNHVTARGKPWSLWYKKHQRFTHALAGALVIIVLLAGGWWYWQSQYIAAAGGVVREGMVGQPERLNPLFARDNPVDAELTPLIFRGLLTYDHNHQLQPDLAEHMEISEDGKQYKLTLSPARWHDGQPVTAEDVAFTVGLTQDPGYAGPMSKSFTNVSVEIVDATTVVIHLQEPYAPFAQTLTLGLLPHHILKDVPASELATHQFNLAPVGNGPLKFQSLALSDDGGWIEEISFTPANGYLESLAFSFYPSLEAAITDFKLGKLHALGSSYSPMLEQLIRFPNTKQEKLVIAGQSYGLFFNLQSSASKDLAVRQALSHAIDRQQFIDHSLEGFGHVISGIYPASSSFHSDKYEEFASNQELSKEVFNQVADKPQRLILLVPDKDIHRQAADFIRQSWQVLGIETEIVAASGAKIQEMLNQHQGYDVVLLGEKFEPDPDRYTNWHSTQMSPTGMNITGLQNKRVDKALEDGRKTLNLDERKSAYETFQSYLSKDVPVIWLYQPNYLYIWNTKLKGVRIEQMWTESDRFQQLEEWYINTQRRDQEPA